MLPEPTERLRFRRMRMTDLDHVAALLVAFDPVRGDRPPSTRDDGVRWIEWQERNHVEHGFGLWVVESHDGAFVGDCGLTVQDVEGSGSRGASAWRSSERRTSTEATRWSSACTSWAGPEHTGAPGRPASCGRLRGPGRSPRRRRHFILLAATFASFLMADAGMAASSMATTAATRLPSPMNTVLE